MSKKKVLVVDDSATVRQQVAAALTNVGFEVVEAEDGQIGADMINGDGSINIVICDVNMPRLNGIDMVLSVKSNQKHANLPILMLTTDGQPALIKKAKEAGARGWIVKPFNPAQLVAAVQKLAGVA
jgi:two-component system chemotaxis response regulator CheY